MESVAEVIERLYSAVDDGQLAALDEIMLRAGLLWKCEVCGENNVEYEGICERCGRGVDGGDVAYTFQYRREQRADFTVVAMDGLSAAAMAERRVEQLGLDSEDDNSDDPGELELVDVDELNVAPCEKVVLLRRARLTELEQQLEAGAGDLEPDLAEEIKRLRGRVARDEVGDGA